MHVYCIDWQLQFDWQLTVQSLTGTSTNNVVDYCYFLFMQMTVPSVGDVELDS